MSIFTYKYRIKESQHRTYLARLSYAANTVWNYCNEVSMLAWRRDRKWLTGYDLANLCAGAGKGLGLHSDTIVSRSPHLYDGDVSSSKLAKTRLAKSTYDAGWGIARTQLTYKASRLAGFCVPTRESFSSVTCSACLSRSGPRGLGALGVREWTCSACGISHDRAPRGNAAHNILRLGRQTPIKEIPSP